VKLCEAFHRYIRHDTCEFHGSASILRVLEFIFPSQMNVASILQFGFLAWYLLNDDWEIHKAVMLKELRKEELDATVRQMVIRFFTEMYPEQGDMEEEEMVAEGVNAAIAGAQKPAKPLFTRWETVADMIVFVSKYVEVLSISFEKTRQDGGAGVSASSMPGMAAAWIGWTNSPQLLACLEMGREFVEKLWKPHNDLIGKWNVLYDCDGVFDVFGRPHRTLNWLIEAEEMLSDFEELPSYKVMLAAYADEDNGEEKVRRLYLQCYTRTVERLKGNSCRYLEGMLVMSSLGDPSFVPTLWEALSHLREHVHRPRDRTHKGEVLEQILRDQELPHYERVEFEAMTSLDCLDDIYSYLQYLQNSSEEEYVAFVKDPLDATNQPDPYMKIVSLWQAAFSHTRPVENSFLKWDQQMRNNSASGRKGKNSAPSGPRQATDLPAAGVRVQGVLAKAKQAQVERRDNERIITEKRRLKTRKIQDASGRAVVFNQTFDELRPTTEELAAARVVVKKRVDFVRVPRDGSTPSPEIVALFAEMESSYHGWVGPRQTYAQLMEKGLSIKVPIDIVCSSECIWRDAERGRGKAISLTCTQCTIVFHAKCMVMEGVLSADFNWTAEAVKKMGGFLCRDCGGTPATNSPPEGVRQAAPKKAAAKEKAPAKKASAKKASDSAKKAEAAAKKAAVAATKATAAAKKATAKKKAPAKVAAAAKKATTAVKKVPAKKKAPAAVKKVTVTAKKATAKKATAAAKKPEVPAKKAGSSKKKERDVVEEVSGAEQREKKKRNVSVANAQPPTQGSTRESRTSSTQRKGKRKKR
jgi:hypothetical protein